MQNPIENQQILLGVSGSVAAYKAVEIASSLTQSRAIVDVVLTRHAEQFVSPLAFQGVTGRKAFTDSDLFEGDGEATHTALGHLAGLVLIAPATAHTISGLAHGAADNQLLLSVLASRCPILIAPAMDASMYSNPATQANMETLKKRGTVVIGPVKGRLAAGHIGMGRMADPADILAQVRYILNRNGPLAGRKIVVTAGATQEPIDPIRYLTNRASGKQGYAIAQAALDAGADVVLITAPTALPVPFGAKILKSHTTLEMHAAVMAEIEDCDALVMAAAVADFRPVHTAEQKIKRQDGSTQIDLEPTIDILADVAARRMITGSPRRLIGFAAETEDLLANAQAKLEARNMDMIVANDVNAPDSGYDVDTNRVTFLYSDGPIESLPTLAKNQVAENLIHKIAVWLGD